MGVAATLEVVLTTIPLKVPLTVATAFARCSIALFAQRPSTSASTVTTSNSERAGCMKASGGETKNEPWQVPCENPADTGAISSVTGQNAGFESTGPPPERINSPEGAVNER